MKKPSMPPNHKRKLTDKYFRRHENNILGMVTLTDQEH